MTEQLDTNTTVDASRLAAAAASLCCRFGEPELEARRRGGIRALLHSSRAFALALERFTSHAAPHARGEHSTTGLDAEAAALTQALADWSFSVNAAAENYQECRGKQPA